MPTSAQDAPASYSKKGFAILKILVFTRIATDVVL